ncbi:UDP-N-acetylmuramate dehydrogenase [Myxosarcina sp. GI1]|uniref:UDP-N-acetylmuramate dehydrogenase n=1 Tax=Myxosarcina sp. GI1 TaxID=1541065 RepID=UPI0005651772|nr:UDP-N-acetylmuramate dehydrogenase [Myxosarcina sp. GI1]
MNDERCLIQAGVSLAPQTSYKVGGSAEWYVAPRNWDELAASFEWYLKQDLPLTLLGAGSNLLISDRGIAGLTISTRNLRGYEFDPETGLLTAEGGEAIAKLAWKAAKRGLKGLEWAVGIPGTVGGGVVMNAGAHQQCMADILVSATVLSPDGTIEELKPEDLAYAYRTSNLQGDNRLVVKATMQLEPGFSKQEISAISQQNWTQRKTTQPYHLPSCGSVFRNPQPRAAGWLIEQLGLKGYKIGDAQIAQRHANFILNCGAAKAVDVFNLIRYAQEKVEAHWSVTLEPEVRLIGEF